MSEPTTPRTSRSAGRSGSRLDLTLLLALLLPVLFVGALVTVPDPPSQPGATEPTTTALTSSALVCPSGDPQGFLATTGDEESSVTARLGERQVDTDVTPGRVRAIDGGTGPLVSKVEGDLAGTLVAGRFATPLAVGDCRAPGFDEWFTGVGAGAKHRSVLELVNPDAGQAVVDVTVLGRTGPVEAPRLRGVAVPGRTTTRLDLSTLVPRTDELALHVVTSRGRVVASVQDTLDGLGQRTASTDYLGAQPEPSASNLLLGLPKGKGSRTLVIANPTDDEVRASLQVVTPDSVFAPTDVDDVVIQPQAVERVPVKALLGAESTEDATGVVVAASGPVTTTLRSFVDGDLALATPSQAFGDATTVVLPSGADKDVLLAGALGAGTARIEARDADGKTVVDKRIDVVAERGYRAELPPEAVLLTVSMRATTMVGSVLLSEDGTRQQAGAVALRRLPLLTRDGQVAGVRPGTS